MRRIHRTTTLLATIIGLSVLAGCGDNQRTFRNPVSPPPPAPAQQVRLTLDAPPEGHIQTTFSGQVSGGSDPCQGVTVTRPCEVFPVSVARDGTVEALLTWFGGGNRGAADNQLALDLWVDTTNQVARASGFQSSTTPTNVSWSQRISAEVSTGSRHELRVIYLLGETIQSFELTVNHPG